MKTTEAEYAVQYRFRPHMAWQTLNMYDSCDKAKVEMTGQKALAEKMGPVWAQYWRTARLEEDLFESANAGTSFKA